MTEHKDLFGITLGDSFIGSTFGAAALVLSIMAIIYSSFMGLLAIAIIVLGASLVLKGAIIAGEYSRLAAQMPEFSEFKGRINGNVAVQMLVGIGGVILAVLALFNLASHELLAAAIVAFGIATIMGCNVLVHFQKMADGSHQESAKCHELSKHFANTVTELQGIAGLSAVVLGVLSLIGLQPEVLTSVSVLTLSGASLINGLSISGKALAALNKSLIGKK